MLQRIVSVLVALPVAILLITLAVANRHDATLVLDPFRPENPAIALQLPFYAYLFAALALGIVAGGTAVWMSQGRWRKTARMRTQEARRWQAEADRLIRERDAQVMAGEATPSSAGSAKQLALVGR